MVFSDLPPAFMLLRDILVRLLPLVFLFLPFPRTWKHLASTRSARQSVPIGAPAPRDGDDAAGCAWRTEVQKGIGNGVWFPVFLRQHFVQKKLKAWKIHVLLLLLETNPYGHADAGF